mgnify:CR=1 FL=1
MLAGLTKHGDGKPTGMSHAGMKITSGRCNDGHTLQVLANFICECCEFEHPYPLVFAQVGLELRETEASAVGETEAPAVGDTTKPELPKVTGSGYFKQGGQSSSGSNNTCILFLSLNASHSRRRAWLISS